MSPELKQKLISRGKSFLWRAGMMIAALTLTEFTEILSLLDLPEYLRIGLGLFLGEVSKYLNNPKV